MRMLSPYLTNRRLNSDLFDEVNRFFDDWAEVSPAATYDERKIGPSCDITETDTHYLVSVDMPGMKKDDIKIEMTDKMLTISGERKRENSDVNKKVQLYEKSYGSFKRSFALPTSVEAEKIEAQYENGVLELYLPKVQAAQPRTIEIQSGQKGFFQKLLNAQKTPRPED